MNAIKVLLKMIPIGVCVLLVLFLGSAFCSWGDMFERCIRLKNTNFYVIEIGQPYPELAHPMTFRKKIFETIIQPSIREVYWSDNMIIAYRYSPFKADSLLSVHILDISLDSETYFEGKLSSYPSEEQCMAALNKRGIQLEKLKHKKIR